MRGVIKILVLGMVVMVIAQPSYDERWEGEAEGTVVVDGDTIEPWAHWTAWVEYDYVPGKDTIWGVWQDTETDAYGNIYGHRNESDGSVSGTWDCANYNVSGGWSGTATGGVGSKGSGKWWINGEDSTGWWEGERKE